MTNLCTKCAALAAGLMLTVTSAHAQQDTSVRIDEHWRAYLGCWASATPSRSVGPMVCVVPTASAQTVEFVTVDGDSIVSTVPLTASGARVERKVSGCSGWESARWSIDERRLYTEAEFTCADGSKQAQQSMISMRYADTFSRIEVIKSGRGSLSRVVHFTLQLDQQLHPASIASRLPSPQELPSFNARLEAAAEVSSADIVDASKALPSSIVEAWIADRGQKFEFGVSDLRAMRGAGVSEGVVDMIVAVSHPQYFTLAQGGPTARPRDPFVGRNGGDVNVARAELERLRLEQMFGGYGSMLYSPYLYGYGAYSRYGDPYGYNSYWGSYGPNYGYGNGWVTGGTPIVIITNPPAAPEPPGRVINGSGYSQGGGSSDRGSEPRSPSVGSWGGGSSSSGSGGGGGSPAPSPAPASSGGEQRTAHPRPPQ